MTHDYRLAREKMVKNQLIPRGIADEGVLRAMGKIHRHLFVEEALIGEAYNDHPLPIGHKQTISQPYIVALMTELMRVNPGDRVLEIGTGSGYFTALLASRKAHVTSVEINPREIMSRESVVPGMLLWRGGGASNGRAKIKRARASPSTPQRAGRAAPPARRLKPRPGGFTRSGARAPRGHSLLSTTR